MSGDHGSSVISAQVRHVEALLESRGLLDAGEVDTRIDEFLAGGSPANGARIVARAWVDPAFRERLLADVNGAAAELGIEAAAARGAERVLLVPGDCPALDPKELDALLDKRSPAPSVVVVPDRHGTGTNALLLDVDTIEDLGVLRAALDARTGGAAHTRGLLARLGRR